MDGQNCDHCPVPIGLVCYRDRGMCERAAKDGEDAFRAVLVRHAETTSQTGLAAAPRSPGLLAKVANFAVAAVKHVAAGAPTVTPEVQAARLAICRTNECGRYQDGTCLSCGCSGKRLEWKASWADQKCPLDPPRWGPIEPLPAADGDTV